VSYTPGPWKVSEIVEPMVYPEDGKTPICLISGMFHAETKRANARLIAAAPELLEALVKLIGLTKNTDDLRLIARVLGGTSESAEKYIQYADEVDIAIEQARAIIAKIR